MRKYINKSVGTFKNDLLPKAIYDVFKWGIIAILAIIPTQWIPWVKSFMLSSFKLSVFEIFMWAIVFFVIGVLISIIIFQKKIKQIQNDNFTDELTKLKNYKALNIFLPKKINEFKSNDKSLSIILIDIDNFKKINDSVGYNTADLILKKVGELLSLEKRATDETFRKFQHVDEFIVILEDTSLSGALIAAERRRKLIQTTSFNNGIAQYKLTVSCGVTELRKDQDDHFSIIERVSQALMLAKKEINKNNTKSAF